ncbi:MAG: hypothetical protein QXV97_04590, partial [Candidatus Caldarchaeum sp.]
LHSSQTAYLENGASDCLTLAAPSNHKRLYPTYVFTGFQDLWLVEAEFRVFLAKTRENQKFPVSKP